MALTLEQEKKVITEYYDLLIEGKQPIFNFIKGNLIIKESSTIENFLFQKAYLQDFDEVSVTLF